MLTSENFAEDVRQVAEYQIIDYLIHVVSERIYR